MTNEGYHLVKVRTNARCSFSGKKSISRPLLLMRIHSTKGKTCGEIHFSHGELQRNKKNDEGEVREFSALSGYT